MQSNYMDSELLAGFKVSKVSVVDNSIILEDDEANSLAILVEGDCCSTATIERVAYSNLPIVLTGRYTEVSHRVLPTSQDVDILYVVDFELSDSKDWYLPCFGFEHRNSSNGYYGNYWFIKKVGKI